MSNAQPPRTFADTITVPCPACKGKGEVMMRIQYTDRRRPCTNAMRTCPVCNGFKVVSAAEDAAFARKHPPLQPCGCHETYPQLRPGVISHGPGCPKHSPTGEKPA